MHQRRLNHFLRLHYPLHATSDGTTFTLSHPDLPDCTVQGDDLQALYPVLESRRQDIIRRCIQAELPVPLPNSRNIDEPPAF